MRPSLFKFWGTLLHDSGIPHPKNLMAVFYYVMSRVKKMKPFDDIAQHLIFGIIFV